MSSISRETEVLKKNQKEMPEITNILIEIYFKKPSIGLLLDKIWLKDDF